MQDTAVGARGSIFLVTRYSIYKPESSGLRLAKQAKTHDAYRQALFAEVRLAARQQVFDAVTAASLMSQGVPAGVEVHWLVGVSDLLPAHHRAKLEATLQAVESAGSVRTKLLTIASGLCDHFEGRTYPSLSAATEEFILDTLRGRDEAFATVRLDDDDALAASFCPDLARFLKKDLAGFLVSFPYGLEGVFDPATGTIGDVRRRYSPTLALGLSFINFHGAGGAFTDERVHVYRLGSHIRMARRNPVILCAQKVGYLRTLSAFNDSATQTRHEYLPPALAEELADLHLPFAESGLSPQPDPDAGLASIVLSEATPRVGKLRARNASLKRKLKKLQAEVKRLQTPADPMPPEA